MVKLDCWFKEQREPSRRAMPVTLKPYLCEFHAYRYCGQLETASGPERLVPGGRYSTDFAVVVATDKYRDALPLARQEKRMREEAEKSQGVTDGLADTETRGAAAASPSINGEQARPKKKKRKASPVSEETER